MVLNKELFVKPYSLYHIQYTTKYSPTNTPSFQQKRSFITFPTLPATLNPLPFSIKNRKRGRGKQWNPHSRSHNCHQEWNRSSKKFSNTLDEKWNTVLALSRVKHVRIVREGDPSFSYTPLFFPPSITKEYFVNIWICSSGRYM